MHASRADERLYLGSTRNFFRTAYGPGWVLLGVSGRSRRLQSARARGLTHFVGRQTEMTVLNTALAQAGAGHGQVVAVVGEAGVGKRICTD